MFTVVAVASLAVAIAAISAVATLGDAVLLRPLPGIAHPERLVSIYHIDNRAPERFSPLSWPDFHYYRDRARSFSGMLAYLRVPFSIRVGGALEKVPGELVSDDYFRVLGVRPIAGRDIAPNEREPVAIIGERLWRDRFGADPVVIGRSIDIGNGAFTIIGIAPATYQGIVLDWGDRPLIWVRMRDYRAAVPQLASLDVLHEWGMQSMVVTARLRDGVTADAAAAEIAALAHRIDADNPERARAWKGQWTARAMPLAYARFWPGARPQIVRMITILLVVAASVLIIACANVTSLMLTRASQRHREVAVRFALGARVRDVAGMLLMESLVLAGAACGIGLLLANALARAIAALPVLFGRPLSMDIAIDARVAAFTALVGSFVAVVVGLSPLHQAMQSNLISSLRSSGAVSAGSMRTWSLRGMLTAVQVALALMLLVQAGLFLRTFRNAASSDPFLRAGNLLIADIEAPSDNEQTRLARDLPAAAGNIPGVRDAVVTSVLPMSGVRAATDLVIHQRKVNVDVSAVSPGFFKLSGSSLAAGRDFEAGDTQGRPLVAIVNEQLAARYWNGDATGRTIDVKGRQVTIIGVVHDENRPSYRANVPPRIYLAAAQQDGGALYLIVRTHAQPEAALDAIRSTVRKLNPNATVEGAETLEQYTNAALSQERLAAWCLGALSAVALLLSVVGLYGTISYSVSQRRAEIGIRIALGGTRVRILQAVLRPTAMICVVGIAAGSMLCIAAARLTVSMIYGVETADPLTWTAAGSALLLAALIAAVIPAHRAARSDPASALRAE